MALKGINKQIIEIRCTNNEYFDKVLLFVKGNANCVRNNILKYEGKKLADSITGSALYENSSKWKKGRTAAVISLVVALLLTAVLIAVMMNT